MSVLYLGVDVAKRTLDAATWLTGAHEGIFWGQYPNTPSGLRKLARRVTRTQSKQAVDAVHLIVEPTGGYELALIAFAYDQGWSVSLPNPKTVRDWASGIGLRAKTDKQDALLLARYGAERRPSPQQPVPQVIQELETLLSRREDLKKLLRAERNRLDNLHHRPAVPEAVQDSVNRVISALEVELAEIEAAIEELIDKHPDLKDKVRKLRTVPGIGSVNVLPLLVLFIRWDIRTNGQGEAKALTAYVGLDPKPFESGHSIHKRATISRMGNRSIRSFLFMGAFGGIRGNSPLRTFYERLVDRGKAKRLALVAAARKILVWAWAVFSQDTVFDPLKAQ